MNFTPLSDQEYAEAKGLWKAGWYAATILDTEDGFVPFTSQKGTQGFKAKIQVFSGESHKIITAYIMAEGAAAFQLRSAAEAFGALDKYKSGMVLPEDFKGKSAFVRLAVEEDKNGQHEPRNAVKDYKATLPKSASSQSVQAPDKDLDDNIPF